MINQIRQLIAEGRTEEALGLLAQNSSEALLLQARFNNGKKQYNMGLIEFSEWQRIQAQINYAALELSNSFKISENDPGTIENGILVIYNEADEKEAKQVQEYLKKRGIKNIISSREKESVEFIREFIVNKFIKKDFVIALFSINSLRDGWVGLDRNLDIFSNAMVSKNFIPLTLDQSFRSPDFINEEFDRLSARLDNFDKIIRQKKLDKEEAEFLLLKATVLRNNLPKIVQRLRMLNTIDISGTNFSQAMESVLQTVRKTTPVSLPSA